MSAHFFDDTPENSAGGGPNPHDADGGRHSTGLPPFGGQSPADDPAAEAGSDELVFQAELAEPHRTRGHRILKRRRLLPISLFILTCFSTFFVGACRWSPWYYLEKLLFFNDGMPLRRAMVSNWDDGVIYMACVVAILLTHEMGHFLATLWHRIPASYPYCLPLPITPFGTLGAVIGMDGLRANRKQMFDIGIAGPLAGLVVAVPILLVGVGQLDFSEPPYGALRLGNPLFVDLLLNARPPEGYQQGSPIWFGQLNPYFMAGWVGFFITGLNMMPVSQLDGGHVIYTLFGKRAHWIARAFMLIAVLWVLSYGNKGFVLMIVLVMLVGTDHPPTSNDAMPLGWARWGLGVISLSIPILCFAPQAIF